ncbi:MAG: glycosyltransferase family 4 protein [Aigarchaeota archaeon]|nr:glycosyltransferase family 4 protein [Aigarchaeota archaeon]MDW8092609.1 glycosyltransferase family 4 protein [Nitrososphaerota archaeon]
MRIVMMLSGRRLGGSSLAMLNLSIGLRGHGLDVTAVTTKSTVRSNPALRRAKGRGVIIEAVDDADSAPLARLMTSVRLMSLIKSEDSIYHVHSPREAFVYAVPTLSSGCRTVATFEGDALYEVSLHQNAPADRVINVVGERVMSRSDAITACSEWLAKRLRSRIGREITGIPNPIDVERFSRIEEWNGQRKVVLSLARLDVVKGVDVLLRAATILKGRRELEFWVAGEGPLRGKLQSMIDRHDLRGRFKLLGHVDTVEDLISESYMLVLPSLYEPFGMPAAEGGAGSRPVVVSDTGGLREIVEDGVNGLLARPGDPRDLAEKIEYLLVEEGIAREMGRRGRALSRRFAPEVVAERFIEVYELALRG